MVVCIALGSAGIDLCSRPQLLPAREGFPAALVLRPATALCQRQRRRRRELGLKAQPGIGSSVLEGLEVAIDGDLRTLQEESGGIFAPVRPCSRFVRQTHCERRRQRAWRLQLAVCVHRTTAQCRPTATNKK